jgi:hypothetical protein
MKVSPLAKGRKLNWHRSLSDHHVKKFAHLELLKTPLFYPASLDLGPKCSPVWDQGQTGSCSGFSSKSGVEFLELNELAQNVPLGHAPLEWALNKFVPVSAFFIYWNERAIEGDTGTDAGATTLQDACTSLQNKGICAEATWPSVPNNLLVCPTTAAYGEAYHHKLPNFYSVDQTLSEMKRCLSNGFPFLFGIAVYDSFMSEQAAMTGIIPMPGQNESLQGGHALLCVGYDDATQRFKFKNSWSTQWGAQGYGFLPYNYMLSQSLADDFYTMRLTAENQLAKYSMIFEKKSA